MTISATDFFAEHNKVKTIGKGAYGKAILCEHRTTKEQLVVKQLWKLVWRRHLHTAAALW